MTILKSWLVLGGQLGASLVPGIVFTLGVLFMYAAFDPVVNGWSFWLAFGIGALFMAGGLYLAGLGMGLKWPWEKRTPDG